jgi:anti-sigma regulatory factor (Ser/Thr protein kinase)
VYRWFLSRGAPLHNVDGEIFSWFGTFTDIDDQRRARDAVQKFADQAVRVSEAFQVASLPESLPKIAGVRFDAVYEAGRAEALVGGDWYDAMRLLDGRILVSVGDVSGSGLAAAVTMNAMRQIIRGAAQHKADPLAILDAADRTLRQERPEALVTAFVGILDPLTFTLHYACAGHPPPIVRRADGRIDELRALGLPLGLWEKGFSDAPIAALDPGSVLVIYTDGLTESTHDFADGERRLFDAIASLNVEKETSCARAIRDKMLVGGARDDVAILTVLMEESVVVADLGVFRWTIDPSEPRSMMRVRDSMLEALRAHATPERSVCDAELIFAELIGNVVRHAPGKIEVVLDASGRLPVLNVIDEGPGFSRTVHLPTDMMREGGRGLFIVSTLAKELNVTKRVGNGSHVRAVLEVGLLD